MVVWSSMRTTLRVDACAKYLLDHERRGILNIVGHRFKSENRLMAVTPSRWQWHKYKDLLHFYFMLGCIPLGLITFCANVFIGPAQLAEIPEDYVPKHWEYHRHPITRFLARYIYRNPQEDYEKYLQYLYEENEKCNMRKVEAMVKEKIMERRDYQAYYYHPISGKYARISKEQADKLAALEGDN